VAEGLLVLTRGIGLPETTYSRLGSLAHSWFDHRVASLIEESDSAIVCTHGSGLLTIERAMQLGVASYIDFPIAHHRYAEALLREEAELQPAFADTLECYRLPPEQTALYDAELEMADRILLPSESCRHSFESVGVDGRKLLVVPYGVDVQLFRPFQRRHARGKFRIVFVGQITQRKGISYLLDAFRLARIPGSELVFIGRPVGTSQAWRSAPDVKHIGHMPRTQLPEMYAAADVFVLPSLIEGLALTGLEAMACGVPVIVSDVTMTGVVRDRVDGLVVSIRDAAAIASHLTFLYENPSERERLAHAARERAVAYSWERYGQRIAATVGDRPGPAGESGGPSRR
jgi:glycosyltransferase involved in cell wall biosynthesis